MKIIKKMVNVLLIAVMLFSELAPYSVMALQPDTANKGDVYNPSTDTVSDSATINANSYGEGGTYKDGDVEVQKIVTKLNDEGKYQVEFKVRGKSVPKTNVSYGNIYAVVVLDKSGSMGEGEKECTGSWFNRVCIAKKWKNAYQGAQKFSTELLSKFPKAQLALVTFSGYEDSKTYDDATVEREFANNHFNDLSFENPSGGTNFEAGLLKAEELLKAIPETDANGNKNLKYIVFIGDGVPTMYYDDNGYTRGYGNRYDETAYNDAIQVANRLKNVQNGVPSGKGVTIYTIGYEVGKNSQAEKVLQNLATDKSKYILSDANKIAQAFTDIADSIKVSVPAGTNATLEDNLGSAFTLTSGNNTLKVDKITEEWQSMGKFTITIDGDSETGWYDTNDGFTLTYDDADGNKQTISSNVNPKVYWVKNQYDYRIEYYYDNQIDNDKTVRGRDVVDTEITVTDEMINNNLKTGYEYKNITTNPIKIKNNGENVIKVYYERKTYTYTVEHYIETENGYVLKDKDTTLSAKYKDTATFNPNNYDGYQYVASKTEKNQNDFVVVDNNLVIKLYYDRNTYSYIVRHNVMKRDGSYELRESETLYGKYNELATYDSKNYAGFKFNESKTTVNQSDYVITDSNKVIDLYYDLVEYNYRVEYLTKDVNGNTYTLRDSYTRGAYYNDSVTADDKNYTGFKYEKTEYTKNDEVISSNLVTDNELVIKVYYVRENYNYKVEHYQKNLDGSWNLVDTDKYNDKAFGSKVVYETNSYNGFLYDSSLDVNTDIKTVPANNDLVIKLYYVRGNYNYKVEHYQENLDGSWNLVDTDNHNDKAFGSKVVYETNSYIGFTYDSDLDVNTNVLTVPANNDLVIKLYYVRNTYSYTVEHYLQNLDGTTYTKTNDVDKYNDVLFGSIAKYEPNVYPGFDFVDSKTTPTVRVVPANNGLVIKLYYDRKVCDYTVNYYFDNELDKSLTDSFKEVYGKTISNYKDKVREGYHLVKDTAPITIDLDSSKNVINVYYERNEYTYRVEYLVKDVNSDTYTLRDYYTRSAYYNDSVTADSKSYTGFKYEKTEYTKKGEIVPSDLVTDNDLVIKVYYVRGNYNYKVEHYQENLDGSWKLVDTDNYNDKEFDSKVLYEVNDYTGFTYDSSLDVNTNVSTIPANNELVIKLYYVRNTYSYTVEHYLQNLDGTTYTKTNDVDKYNDVLFGSIAKYEPNVYPGFDFVDSKTTPTVRVVPANNGLVIKLYYDRKVCDYTVNYYFDNELDKSLTDSFKEVYGKTISNYKDKVREGYHLVKDTAPITIDLDSSKNVINVYYERNEYTYRVEYLVKDVNSDTYTLRDYYTRSAYYNDSVTADSKSYTGFKYEKTEYTKKGEIVPSDLVTDNDLVIKVYYVRGNYNYKVEHYQENLDGSWKLVDTDNYNDKEFDSKVLYEVNDYTGFTYDSSLDVNTNVSTVPANNELVIKLYYVRNTYKYTVEHYLENDDDDNWTLQVDDTRTFDAKYNEEASYTSNEYTNYTFDDSKTTPEVKVVLDDNLVIKLYYVKNRSNVKVHYVIKDVDTGKYIPFETYGVGADGNNTEDFIGLDLLDLVLTGKVSTKFSFNGRNPKEYKFVGLYSGNLLEDESYQIISSDSQEYTGEYGAEDQEFTYVYQAPTGDIPPITGINALPLYINYLLVSVLALVTFGFVKYSKKNDME